MFQFYAGDLYEVFPKMRELFYATDPVDGHCVATYNGLKIWRSHIDAFNVSIHYDCELEVNRQRLISFGVGLQLEVKGRAEQAEMDFELGAHEEFISFYPTEFKMENEELARKMVSHSINRLYFEPLFGSGWSLNPPRDYPHLITSTNYTIVYDSTHIEPDDNSTRVLPAQELSTDGELSALKE